MFKDVFVTRIAKGTFEVTDQLLDDYNKWVEIEKLLDSTGSDYSTTVNGWQKPLSSTDKKPVWIQELEPTIIKITNNLQSFIVKSSWVIEYNINGYQDIHMHVKNGSNWTIIFNIQGSGNLLLHDPRPHFVSQTCQYLEDVFLKSGDWIAIPSWLMHSSRPCQEKRSIFVMDIQ